ncbi:MAG: methyltransferase domain-containing protein, partial [Gammaproteobacteria bacterium]|nr:methyltransferase domain-containing protein [Gammaproteobacteria bacterium]
MDNSSGKLISEVVSEQGEWLNLYVMKSRKLQTDLRQEGEAVLSAALLNWYQLPPGAQIWPELEEQISNLLADSFGYYGVWLGPAPAEFNPDQHSRVRHHFQMLSGLNKDSFLSDAEALPIQSESVDLVVLVHGLELSQDPHQLLREVDRILVPEGNLLIIHFDPVSWYGLARLALFWKKQIPWKLPFYTGFRVRDWMSLLGYDVLRSRGMAYRPPMNSYGLYERLGWFERFSKRFLPFMNGLSLIHARKRVMTLTPVRQRWRPGR